MKYNSAEWTAIKPHSANERAVINYTVYFHIHFTARYAFKAIKQRFVQDSTCQVALQHFNF